jgi:cobalt-zinc-cadmium resistance protein CzcA
MLRSLIAWPVGIPHIVALCLVALTGAGSYSFINVEAYPDSAPITSEVFAQYSGVSADEGVGQATVPLEDELAYTPGLKYARPKPLAGVGPDLTIYLESFSDPYVTSRARARDRRTI